MGMLIPDRYHTSLPVWHRRVCLMWPIPSTASCCWPGGVHRQTEEEAMMALSRKGGGTLTSLSPSGEDSQAPESEFHYYTEEKYRDCMVEKKIRNCLDLFQQFSDWNQLLLLRPGWQMRRSAWRYESGSPGCPGPL